MISKVASMGLRSIFSLLGFDRPKPALRDSDLSAFQKAFNLKLKGYLEAKASSFSKLADEPLAIATMGHCVSLMNDGGKRVRPYMAFLAYCTEGGSDDEEILKLGIGLEIFHAFALIHDDIIDGGTERHGLPTTHEFVKEEIADCDRGDRRRVSEGMALLAGDLAFSWAGEAIARSGNKQVQDIYYAMIEETVAGQMLDVTLVIKDKVESKTLTKKNELKTARYSFVNPMLMGAAQAGSHGRDAFYVQLGLLLGQAFQIQDDLLDVVGDPHQTGKTTMLDIQDGQHTLITQHVFEKAAQRDKEVLMSLFGKPVDDHARKVLSRLFESTGAIRHAVVEISSLFSEARKLIEASDMKRADKDRWISFIALLDKRKS